MKNPKAYSTDKIIQNFISVDHELIWVHGVITEDETWHDESHSECNIYGINTMMNYWFQFAHTDLTCCETYGGKSAVYELVF